MPDLPYNIKFQPEVVIDIIIKRRWFIIIPFCLSLMVGIYQAITLPKIFEAETLILVEAQRVPQEYVKSVVSIDISSRISTISQQIMSRTNLEKVIKDFKLFSEEAWQGRFLEDQIENLRNRITVDVINRRYGADAFRIAFRGPSPEKVMNVANALASYFINENLKVREMQAIGTSSFLEAELDSMRTRLEEKEEKLREYKRLYMGGLPEQLETNLKMLESLQIQKHEKQTIIREIEQNIYNLNNTANPFTDFSMDNLMVDFEDGTGGDDSYELTTLREELERLKLKYMDKHPDVMRLKKRISELEAQNINEETDTELDQALPAEIAMPTIDFQKVQLDELKSSLVVHKREFDEINSQIVLYKKNIDDTPRREQELLFIQRDYDNLKSSYESLLKRKLESEIAVNMERRQKGEQFRIVDSAQLPEKPISPNMQRLFVLFLAVGFAVGAGVVFLLEYFDNSFMLPEEIEKELDLTVLCTVPQIHDSKAKQKARIEKIVFCAFCALSMVMFTIFALLTQKGVDESLDLLKKVV